MSPKKPKDFIKPTAIALEKSETLVDDVVGFYWASVRRALSGLEGPSIAVASMGTFKARYNKIPQMEKKYNSYLSNIDVDSMTFNKHTTQNISKEKLEGLGRLRTQLEDERKRKGEVKTKRNDYISKKALDEQVEDTRGSEE